MAQDPLLTEAEAAAMLVAKPATLVKWRARSRGPVFYKLSGKIRYRTSDIESFIEESRHEPGARNGERRARKRASR